MPDSNGILMGGPHSGIEVAFDVENRPFPPGVRTMDCGSSIMTFYPMWHCGGPGERPLGGEPRYMPHGWESSYYQLTEYRTTTGLSLYEWVDPSGWSDNGKTMRKDFPNGTVILDKERLKHADW